ncbi:hypothetical protein LSAT2_027955 [Lamellibrachia satsuma]|nr:hypothetical protein LSAT2_027955 [Lamellibrachia satsuma]
MLVLLGKISCGINLSEMTCSSHQAQKKRVCSRANYMVESHHILYVSIFKFLHPISNTKLTGLLKWCWSILQAVAWYQGYQHIMFHSAHPGKVFVHSTLNSTKTVFSMMTTEVGALPSTAPVAVPAPGMGAWRQSYLYDIIQEFQYDNYKHY